MGLVALTLGAALSVVMTEEPARAQVGATPATAGAAPGAAADATSAGAEADGASAADAAGAAADAPSAAGVAADAAGAAADAAGAAGAGSAAVAAPLSSKEEAAAPARARGETFTLELASADPSKRPPWQVEALSSVLSADLVGDGLRAVRWPAEDGGVAAAPACRARGCDVGVYRAAGVTLVVRARLAAAALEYQLWWLDGEPVALRLDGAGAVPLDAGLARKAVGQALVSAIKDAQRRRSAAILAPSEAPAEVAAPELGVLAGAWLVLLALALSPLLLALLAGVPLARWARLRSTRISAGVVLVAAAALVGFATLGEAVTETPTTVYVLGGLAWGVLITSLVPAAFPPLVGLSRVEYYELFLVFRAWASAAWRRTALVGAAVVGFGTAAVAAADALGLSSSFTWGVAIPLGGLALRHAARAAVEVLAQRLDRALVDGEAGPEEPWHGAVAGYLRGYFRRNGLGDQERLLDNVWFLPGSSPGISVYGGGVTASRVVIDRVVIERALAPYGRPHDYAAPRVSTLHWMQWNAGLITPAEVGSVVATRAQRQPRELTVEGEDDELHLFGEPVTLAGIVEPSSLDPRRPYQPHNDTSWLSWDPGDEHDGTDASDQDWLFGALVVALGAIHRGEDRMATLRRSLQVRATRRGAPAPAPATAKQEVGVHAGSGSASAAASAGAVSSMEPPASRATGEATEVVASTPPVVVESASAAPQDAPRAVDGALGVEAGAAPRAVDGALGVEAGAAPRSDEAEEPRMVDGTKEFAAVDPEALGVVASVAPGEEPGAAPRWHEEEPRMVDGTKEFAAVDPEALGVEPGAEGGSTSWWGEEEPRMVDGTKEFAAVDPEALGVEAGETPGGEPSEAPRWEEEEPRMVDGTKELAAVDPEALGVEAGAEAGGISWWGAEEPRMVDGTKEFAAVDPEALGIEPGETPGREPSEAPRWEAEEPRMVDGTKELAAVDPEALGVEASEAPGSAPTPRQPEEEQRLYSKGRARAARSPAASSSVPDARSAGLPPRAEEPAAATSAESAARTELDADPVTIEAAADAPSRRRAQEFAAVSAPVDELALAGEASAAVSAPVDELAPVGEASAAVSAPVDELAPADASPAGAAAPTGPAVSAAEAPTGPAVSAAEAPTGPAASAGDELAGSSEPTSTPPASRPPRPRRAPSPALPAAARLIAAPPLPPGLSVPPPASSWLGRLVELWDRGAVRLGDTQAALHGARHHLVQSLGRLLLQREDLLTARAHPPELQRVSNAVLRAAERRAGVHRVLAARLRWLVPFVHGGAPSAAAARQRRARRLRAVVLAVSVAVAALSFAIAKAITFHDEYLQRTSAGASSSLRSEEGSSDHEQRH
ncbi:MAG: hypothetical protein R3B48_12585 [Kofleriaceae bacterium]